MAQRATVQGNGATNNKSIDTTYEDRGRSTQARKNRTYKGTRKTQPCPAKAERDRESPVGGKKKPGVDRGQREFRRTNKPPSGRESARGNRLRDNVEPDTRTNEKEEAAVVGLGTKPLHDPNRRNQGREGGCSNTGRWQIPKTKLVPERLSSGRVKVRPHSDRPSLSCSVRSSEREIHILCQTQE